MMAQLPDQNQENITKMKLNLPTYIFEYELMIKDQDAKKRTKRRRSDLISDVSSTSAYEEMATIQYSLHEQILCGNSQNIFPGRFILPKGRSACKYPRGYFHCMIETRKIPPSMIFPSYFKLMVKKQGITKSVCHTRLYLKMSG
jgi:hypothetical protein